MSDSAYTRAWVGHSVITAATQPTTPVVYEAVPTSVTTGGSMTLGFTGGDGADALTNTPAAQTQAPRVAHSVSPIF